LRGGAGMSLNHVPTRDHIASGELFEDHAGHGTHVEGIDLDQVARLQHRVLLGFAHGIGTRPQGPARSRNSVAGRFHQSALAFQLGENATHHGNRNRQVLAAQQNCQLVLAPAGKLQPQPKTLSSKGKDQVGWRRRRGQ
jgi:hypothetical protein